MNYIIIWHMIQIKLQQLYIYKYCYHLESVQWAHSKTLVSVFLYMAMTSLQSVNHKSNTIIVHSWIQLCLILELNSRCQLHQAIMALNRFARFALLRFCNFKMWLKSQYAHHITHTNYFLYTPIPSHVYGEPKVRAARLWLCHHSLWQLWLAQHQVGSWRQIEGDHRRCH